MLMLFLTSGKAVFSENYHIDGYILAESVNFPVNNQIIEISDQFGANLASFLTNDHGLYTGNFQVSSEYSHFVNVQLSRRCNDTILFYNQQIQLSNPYLTCNFFVCDERPCHANFNYNQNSPNSLLFEFTDISQGNVSEWSWDFGDQTFSNEQNPTHEFSHPSHYQVKLTVTGSNCNDTRQKSVFAFYEDCLARFTYENVNQGGEIIVQFHDESIGNIDEWFWEFGDGMTSNLQNPSHHYNDSGEYEVKLSIFGPGCMNTNRQTIILNPVSGCFALFNSEQVHAGNLKVFFTDLSIGTAESWLWDFGDGMVSTQQNPVHIYENAASYQVIFKTSGPNCDDTFSRLLQLLQSPACLPDFSYQQNSILEPVIEFTNLTNGGNLEFFWDFGDGSTSMETSPVHQFPSSGFYDVTLKTIGFGCTDSLVKPVEVKAPIPCVAEFSFSSESSVALEIFFTNESTGMINSFAWNFGDNSYSNDENPVHTYAEPGSYMVTLRIDAIGCTDSINKTVRIDEPVFCAAVFSVSQEYPQSRLISFINESVGNNYSSSWDFGDGSFSSETNPQHEYNASGQYVITLTISTNDNCNDTLARMLDILPPLVLSGNVYAGPNLLSLGNVFLYKNGDSGNLDLLEYSPLENGNFQFTGLRPGSYFLQAIPDFNFPFPVIPNYFPTYAGERINWSEAQVFETSDLPSNVEIDLLHYDDFFDGKASISGKLQLIQGTPDFPVFIYLTSEMNSLRSFKILSSQSEFEFAGIPYGSYKLLPEKAGKNSQAFIVELTEESPESKGIIFNETETSIVPDLTVINDPAKTAVFISPDPADDFVLIELNNTYQGWYENIIRLFASDQKVVMNYSFSGNSFKINVSDLRQGIYVLELNTGFGKVHKKIIIRH